MGFFTDTSVCIGCKACEVACKEWNTLPMDDADGKLDAIGLSGMSYDNTGMLGANSWRHVAFIEQARTVDLPMPGVGLPGARRETPEPGVQEPVQRDQDRPSKVLVSCRGSLVELRHPSKALRRVSSLAVYFRSLGLGGAKEFPRADLQAR